MLKLDFYTGVIENKIDTRSVGQKLLKGMG